MSLPPVETLAVIDSTNAEAKRRAAAGFRGPLWLRAETQTGGVGRGGRAWHSPPGNLYTTLLTPWAGELRDAALMSFVACLAVADALDVLVEVPDARVPSPARGGGLGWGREHSERADFPTEIAGASESPPSQPRPASGGKERITLKWPNDALLDGKKVAGVLLEAGGTDTARWLAIGVGINLAHKPTEARWPAIALSDVATPSTAQEAMTILAEAFDTRQHQFETHGFAPIRTAWLSRAARLGEPIEARLANAAHTGIFEGIAEDGALVLGTDAGTQRFAAADVYFPA